KLFRLRLLAVLTLAMLSIGLLGSERVPSVAAGPEKSVPEKSASDRAVFESAASSQEAPKTGHTMVIAHRGGSKESTENSIGAFQRASRIGADGIETDIRLTRDGVVVVYHDDYFGRVEGLAAPLRTRLISDMTYAELTKQTLIPVGEDKGGRHIPKLDDLLSQVKGVLLNIELKRCARFDE